MRQMNTKKYLALFASMAERDELPRDLYDMLLAEIAKNGGMNKRIYSMYLDELERRGMFDTDGAPFDTKNSAKTDGTYKYRSKNPFKKLAHAFWFGTFKFIGWVGGAIVFGVWRVKDRKKLKGIGACITTSNHVGYLDAVLTLRSMGSKRQNIVAAPHNCKHTVGGRILGYAGMLPLPVTVGGARPFNDMLKHVAARKSAIHFYVEKSMWIGYKKPRPYKDGAFFYADMLDIPVVPMLYCFKKPRGLRKLLHMPKAVIKISDPIYINKELPPRERRTEMCERAQAAAKAMYEEFYGIPLQYLGSETNTRNIVNDNEIIKTEDK